MSRKAINAVIIIGVLSIIGILIAQLSWVNRTIQAQKDTLVILERQDSLNIRQFEESVRVALRHAVEEITTYQVDSSDVYGAVKQQSSNYYLVDINEDLHPYYLEQVLKRTFYLHGIEENYQYGIYDCYNDSIVYGNLIRNASTADSLVRITSPELLWDKDGHYFTVYFPEIVSQPSLQTIQKNSPWNYLGFISIVLIGFFAFAVSIIIRQKRISEVKTDFVNNMTHELKTPISTIGLSSEMLMQADYSQNQDQLRKYAEIIFKENKRLEQQVERVLNIAKLDSSALELQKENLDIHELISEITADFNYNNTLAGGRIELELLAENRWVLVDAVHITNIIFNLLDNAIKYSKDTPVIKIASKNTNKGIEIAFEDTGMGIAKDKISHLFEQFYRVPKGDTHDVKGFGLGLYYVKIVVDKHKGKINVSSKEGEGTTFSVWLPQEDKS